MFDPAPIRIDTDAIVEALRSRYRWVKGNILFFVLLLTLSLAIAAGVHYLGNPRYKATSTFVLEEKSPTAGMAGIASQFGIDLGSLSGGTTGFFSGENISDIIKSSGVIQQVLLSDALDQQNTLADLYLESAGLRTKRGWNGRLTNFRFKTSSAASNRELFDTTLLVITKQIREKDLQVEKTNRKGSIYSVSFTADNPALAAEMTPGVEMSLSMSCVGRSGWVARGAEDAKSCNDD